MASAKSIKAGEAFIMIKAIDAASPVLRNLGKNMMRMGRSVMQFGMAFGAVGGVIMGSLIKPIKIASEVTEQQNKFFQIFGTKVGKEVEERMRGIARETGRTHLKMYKFAGSFGGLMKGQGATTEMAADVTKALLKMGIDFSSFNDILDDTREGSMNRFLSALSGSAEVLDRFGVTAKESALGPQLQKMFGVGTRGASDLQKTLARTMLVYQSMERQGAMDDAIRTQKELANAWRNFQDVLFEIGYYIGSALLPIVGAIVQYLLKAGMAVSDWVQEHQNLVIAVALVGATLLSIGVIITSIGLALYVMGIALTGMASILTAIKMIWIAIAAIVTFINSHLLLIGAAALAIGMIVALWLGLFSELSFYFRNFLTEITAIGKALWKAFSTGRFELAWKIFFNTIQIGWEYIVLTATKLWAKFLQVGIDVGLKIKDYFMSAFDVIFTFIMENLGKLAGLVNKLLARVGMSSEMLARVAEETSAYADDLGRRQLERDKFSRDFSKTFKEVTDEYWQDNQRNIERLKKESYELQKEAFDPGAAPEDIVPSEPGATDPKQAAFVKSVIPNALERGTLAASKKARENAQTAALNNIEALTEEGNEQRGNANEMLQEMLANTGAV